MTHTKAAVKSWESVPIFGVGGAVSHAALQILADTGVTTSVTSHDESKLERALSLGATHAIASREDVARRVPEISGGRGVDVVVENVGKAVWPSAMKAVVRGGRIVTCGATIGLSRRSKAASRSTTSTRPSTGSLRASSSAS